MATTAIQRGVFGVGMLRLKSGAVIGFYGSGAPTNGTSGTGAGQAPNGSMYHRTSNGAIYVNTNTKASPTWTQLGTTPALTSAHLFVGNGSNVATDVAASGDVALANTGAFTLAEDLVRRVDVTITSAQLLALNATPRSLVAAPGANKALIFLGAMLTKAAGTAYGGIAGGEDLAVKYTDGSGLDVGEAEATGFLDQATAQFRYVTPIAQGTPPVSSYTPTANAALVLHLLSGEITTGDSDLKVRTFYRVVPTVL